MPKSRKRPRKATKRQTSRPNRPTPQSSLPPVIGNFSFSRGFGIGQATDEDWDRLRQEFLHEYPACPDCGGPWDLDTAGEEEGTDIDGKAEITFSVMCAGYEDDLDAGREPRPHGRTDGMMQYAITLA